MKFNCFLTCSKLLRLQLFVFIILQFGLSANAQLIDFSSCPTCNSTQISLHTEIKDKYLGVQGNNPSRPTTYNLLGTNKFEGFPYNILDIGIVNNWHPIRLKKQILVGRLEKFGISNYGDESDWNIHLVPNLGFESFLPDALNQLYPETKEWDRTSDGNYTIEAEITPITNAFNNPWFNNISQKTYLLNQQIGAYGPFVGERLHGYRPEIHPAEQIWWKDTANSTVILLMADASDRFDQMSDYDEQFAVDGNRLPWTNDKGQEAELKIPFEVNPVKGSVVYNLYSLYDNNSFFIGANYSDTSNGTKHTITYRGTEVLTFVESSIVEKYVGVTFRDVCFDANTSMLKGFIVLKTAIGNGGDGKEGFVALQIDKNYYNLNEKPGVIIGNIINSDNSWTTFNKVYDTSVAFTDNEVITSDKYGKGIVDGLIDFNGNGKTDFFAVKSNKWMVLFDGQGQWQEINNSVAQLKDLRFGDINGDGITDILYVNGQKKVLVSYSGVQTWQIMTDAGEQTKDIRVGDFNGDGRTDIVYMKFMGLLGSIAKFNMYIKYSCTGSWQELNTNYQLNFISGSLASDDYNSNFRFGNFNGDNTTDIFRYYKNKFMVYWSGKGYMKELCSPLVSNYNMNDFLFVDNLSRIGYTDVIYAKRSTTVWKIYYEGKIITPGKELKYFNPFTVHFGNLDNDGFWEPIVVDGVKQTSIPSDLISTANRTIKLEPFVLPEYEKGSIKRNLINGKPVLTVNMKLQYHEGTTDATRRKENFQTVAHVKDKGNLKDLLFQPTISTDGKEKNLGKIENIPIRGKKSEIQVKFSGISTPFDYEVSPYGISALNYGLIEKTNGLGNWNIWESYLKPKVESKYTELLTTAPSVVEKIKFIQFELYPFYSSIENGEISILEMGDMAKDLNSIIYGDNSAKIAEIFGTSSLFTIRWKFELNNISTGKPLPVKDSLSIISSGRWNNNKIKFTFPDKNELMQFKATATIEDNLGNISPNSPTYIFYNQRIKFTDIKSQLPAWFEKIRISNESTYLKIIQNMSSLADDNIITIEEILRILKS